MEKLTVSSLINTPIDEYSSMDKGEVSDILKQAVKMANQRIRRLEAAKARGVYSYSLDYLEEVQGTENPRYRYSKSLTRNQMLGRLRSIKAFMDNESSTVKGAMKQQKAISERLRADRKKGENLKDITVEEGKTIFNAYKKALESDPYFGYMYGSEQLQRLSYRLVVQNGMDEDTAAEYMREVINQRYEDKEDLAIAAYSGSATSAWEKIKDRGQ